MSNQKKSNKFIKFLEEFDKDLYQVFDELCMFSLFKARGISGITFLYPTDIKYRKKIINLAYSYTPEKAVDMVKALVLIDYLPKPMDFKKKQDDIPNSLRKKLEIEDADSKGVILKCGLKLELDKSYTNDDYIAVYKLIGSTELPLTGTQSTLKYTHNKSLNKLVELSDAKKKISKFVEYIHNKPNGSNIYHIIIGLICKMATTDTDKELIYNNLCASDRASYYNIICPYSSDNPCNISNNKYEQLSTINMNNWHKYKDNLVFIKFKDKLILDVRKQKNIDYEKLQLSNIKKQKRILDEDSSPIEYISSVKKTYTDNRKLYKDLLTIYCYVSTIKESEDPRDTSYYKQCFLPVIKNVFNDQNQLLVKGNDLAHNLTLYGNLIKSDAFMFIPILSTEEVLKDYEDFGGFLPEPTNKGKLFTISKNILVNTYIDDDDSISALLNDGNVSSNEKSAETKKDVFTDKLSAEKE